MPWLPALAMALLCLLSGCAVVHPPPPSCVSPFVPSVQVPSPGSGPGPWWLAGGLLLGFSAAWLWRRWRLAQALAQPGGLFLPGEVGRVKTALGLIEDLVLTWQERALLAGPAPESETAAPASGIRAGAAEPDGGFRPGGQPPAR